MAHQLSPDEVDALAAEAAAAEEPAKDESLTGPVPAETTLAYGAEGECVTKLVNLLAVLGFTSNAVIQGGAPRLDESVLANVRAAQQQLDVAEPEVTSPDEIPVGVKGELVGTATWAALYEAAAAKLEQQQDGGAASSA